MLLILNRTNIGMGVVMVKVANVRPNHKTSRTGNRGRFTVVSTTGTGAIGIGPVGTVRVGRNC